MSDKLRIQITGMIRLLERKSKVIHRKHVFQKLRLLEVTYSTRRPALVERMSKRIGLGVEVMIVLRFVDANAPENDRWMVPVAANHAANVIDRRVLPRLVADMLPSRNLFQHQKSNLVATVKKMPRLRIMRRPNNVAMQIVSQNLGILPLHTRRHCLTDKGKGLMTIEPAQL